MRDAELGGNFGNLGQVGCPGNDIVGGHKWVGESKTKSWGLLREVVARNARTSEGVGGWSHPRGGGGGENQPQGALSKGH